MEKNSSRKRFRRTFPPAPRNMAALRTEKYKRYINILLSLLLLLLLLLLWQYKCLDGQGKK